MRAPFHRWLCGVLVGILLAAFAAQPADAGRFGFGFRHKTQTIVAQPPPPPPATVTYDTTMGASVDTLGMTALPLRTGAHAYFVKNSGSDANTCTAAQNPATPKATIASGVGCITSGNGDQVLLAEGSTFAEVIPYVGTGTKDGFSALYPTVISSYDPADPTNTAKYGRGDQRNARPILTGTQNQVANEGPHFFAFKGLEFSPGNVPGASLAFSADNTVGHGITYLLLENNVFRYTGASFQMGQEAAGTITGGPIVVRNNSFYSMWNTSGFDGGLYVGGAANVTNEDNVYYHNGWNETVARSSYTGPDPGTSPPEYSAWVASGGPTFFSHSYYFQTNTTGIIVRRNLSMEGAGDGGIARGDTTSFTENLFIDNPAAIGMGGGNAYNTDGHSVSGVSFPDVSYNAILGSDNLATPWQIMSWGINSSNGKPGNRIHHNLIVNSLSFAGSGNSGFSNVAQFPQPSYAHYDHNLIRNWVSQSVQTNSFFVETDANASYGALAAHDYNNWDGLALGTNTNNGSSTFPNAYTETSFFSALTASFPSITDKASFITYVINHPEAHVQRPARALLFAGYGITAPADTTAPVLSAPVGSAVSTTATIGATTDTGEGALYWAVLPSTATAPVAAQVELGVNASSAAATSAGSINVSSLGAKSTTTTLATGTYKAYFMHEDVQSNQSAVLSSSAFTVGTISATWDAVKSPDWALSGASLIATHTANAGGFWSPLWGSASRNPVTASSSYTATLTTMTGGSLEALIGLNDSTAPSAGGPGQGAGDSDGISYQPSNGNISFAGNALYTVATSTQGDAIKWVIVPNTSFDLYKNGTLLKSVTFAVLAANVGGTPNCVSNPVFPIVTDGGSLTGTVITGDFTSW